MDWNSLYSSFAILSISHTEPARDRVKRMVKRVPIMMFTGIAVAPRKTVRRISNRRTASRIAIATQRVRTRA